METLFYNLFTRTPQPLARYIYRRIARPYVATIDPTVVHLVATDFSQFGTSTTQEGQDLETIVLDQFSLASPNISQASITTFMNEIGDEMLVDYPASVTASGTGSGG